MQEVDGEGIRHADQHANLLCLLLQKLHFALFMALKKATYKPGAFYKVGPNNHAWPPHCCGVTFPPS